MSRSTQRNRKSSLSVSMVHLLIALMVALSTVITPSIQRAEAAPGDLFFDFESFALGPLNGQFGWTNASPEVTVTDQVYAVSGSKAVKVVDNDKTKAMGARLPFQPMETGSVEWWAKADTADRFVMLLESTGTAGTKPVEWIGLLANGTFEYYDGATRLISSETYETGKWYRFRVDFNAATHKKTIYVFDGSNLLLWKKDTAFRDETATNVNLFRIATISTSTGTFYMDNVRIRSGLGLPTSPLQSLQMVPDSINVQEGKTGQVHLLGSYADGDIRLLEEQAAYVAQDPSVASVVKGIVTGLASGTTVVNATYGAMQASLEVNVFGANEVPPYKNLHPRTLQKTTSMNDVRIVAPTENGWSALGQSIATKLRQKWNIEAQVVAPDAGKFSEGWSGNTLILGNLGNNRQMARLYGLRMSYADAVYPGQGGYQLQTAIDPFGLGGNTIVLGASDLTGANEGTNRLLQLIDQQTAVELPWVAEVKLAPQTETYMQYDGHPTEAQLRTALANADKWIAALKPTTNNETDATALQYLFSRIKIFGENYQLTGHPAFGEIYRKLLKGYSDFANRYPVQAMWQLNEPGNMWTDGDTLIQNWAVMEASPIFTALDRKQITSALYLTYEANAKDRYLAVAKPSAPRWNHEIFPALSLIAGSDFFGKYYHLPETVPWKQLGDRIFTGNTSYISLDEGSDYLMHVPMTNIDYAMAVGNLDFIARSLRPSADLHSMMIDNLGTMSGGGDTYPFGASSAYSWGHAQVMNAASWFYGDPLYLYLLERAKTGPFPGQRMSDLDFPIHRYTAVGDSAVGELPPGNYAKLQAYPVEQGVYDDVRDTEQTPLEVDVEDAFHKMTFREGYGQDDSYLILDGFSAGKHGHQDGNAILNYSANGRLFLTDRDYIENTSEHHSGLVVVKDGEQKKKPPLAKLEWAADIEGTGLSRSTVPNYNGTDWQRSIVSPNGNFYVIYDDISFREGGRYLLKNLWQSMGEASIANDGFEVEQQGVTMDLKSLDASDLRLQDRYGHFVKYWKTVYPYPYANKETVLSEVVEEKQYGAGERQQFINVLSSRKSDESAVITRRLNETTLEIKDKSAKWLAVQSALNTDHFSSNGAFHLIGEGQLLAAEATDVRIGSTALHFAQPVMFKLDTATGKWAAYGLRKDKVHYDAQGQPVRDAALDSGTVTWSKQMQQRLEHAVFDRENPTQWKKPHPDQSDPDTDWQKVFEFQGTVTDSAKGDLNGDGKEELVLAGSNGTVTAVTQDGAALWSFTAQGRVNEVTVQQLAGQTTVFVATENWYVHALDAQGNEKWKYKFPSDTAHREQKGNLVGITNVRVAYVNGADQEPWVMVGTQFRYIYGLDPSGNLKYEDLLYYYGIEDMEFADFDGDGKEEGMFGLEYAYYAYWNEKAITRSSATGGPGWKVVEALKSWNGDEPPAVAFGTKQNEVRLIQYKGKLQERWVRNVGGEVNDVRAGDFNGDGEVEILAGTDGFQFYALAPDGTVRFRTTLNDRVLQVDGWNLGDQTRYLAAADNGLLYTLGDQGAVQSAIRFSQRIVDMSLTDGGSKPWIVLENGEVYRSR
ncbi:PQQ-binding-like beta-propeller repeat protein [Paenibacillus allorhizosphaerae]|uniref:Lambda-carrageenase beta-propeller domain-containing protein n=1 Tax=Paenibacillus allorhizosphaerae TaxID=2849866 RepID=A0ABM8VDC3_9BACL|nr:PQQ-binding-like beta-propeller repeat protein [Paenibacillus allorhizosphaerae]CAG7627333.1 hypothetical protein PAECIP111802_01342 [Paenibacillus allorhizosphaerae]